MPTTRFKGETASERLDYTGISDSDMIQLRHKPGTIEDADKGISKSQLQSCPFGVSDTAAGTGAKVASLTDSNPDFILVSGREVVVCFTTANTASNPTLNFAGSGAIPLYYTNGAAVGSWAAGTWMHLKYFYATVGGQTIQRWILLSPLPVNVVEANNLQSVTSAAVANRIGLFNDNAYTPSVTIQQSIRASFNSAASYSLFYSGSQNAEEGGWYAFKHGNYGTGIFLSRGNVVAFYIDNEKFVQRYIISL